MDRHRATIDLRRYSASAFVTDGCIADIISQMKFSR